MWEKNENKQKEAEFGPFSKKSLWIQLSRSRCLYISVLSWLQYQINIFCAHTSYQLSALDFLTYFVIVRDSTFATATCWWIGISCIAKVPAHPAALITSSKYSYNSYNWGRKMFCSTNPLKDIECVYLSVWERDNKRVGERENKIERVCVWERERERERKWECRNECGRGWENWRLHGIDLELINCHLLSISDSSGVPPLARPVSPCFRKVYYNYYFRTVLNFWTTLS